MSPRVDLDNPVDRAIEECPVVRHDHEPTFEAGYEPLESLQPVEVEIVRRLVETEDVESREQHRGERRPRCFATREALRRLIERDRKAEIRADSARARFEIRPPEREKSSQCRVIAVVTSRRAFGKRNGFVLELHLGSRDSGAPPQRFEQRLGLSSLSLLRNETDGKPGRFQRHLPGIGLITSCDQAQQRRLADPVRPDHAETAAGADSEADILENRLGAVVLRDACKLHSHCHS